MNTKKYAIIENGIIVNFIVWNSGENPNYKPKGTLIEWDDSINSDPALIEDFYQLHELNISGLKNKNSNP